MTYVYVLVSGKNDLYYEQALMSTYSLRNLMPDANVVLLVDNKTEDLINSDSLKRAEIKKYVSKIISVQFDEKVSNAERSRLIKTSIPEYAKTGLDMAHFFGVSQNGDKLDYSQFFSTDDKVLCFDDLERANVDVIDILRIYK